MPTSVSLRTRGIPFTQNNWTTESYEALQRFGETYCIYMVLGKEVGESGTPHIQGFLYFENPRAYPCKKFRAISNGAHDEMLRGTPKQAADYCKKDGDFWEFGEVPSQGARTDWVKALEDIKSQGVVQAVENQPHLIPCVRALSSFKQMSMKSTHRDVQVHVLIGPPGCGKTKWAWDNYPDLYTKPDGQWWDGYAGEETVLLDDFGGDLAYTTLLKVLDRYPLQLPVKGGFVAAKYTTVIITSNKFVQSWWKQDGDIPSPPLPALRRRFTIYRNMYITDAPEEEEPASPPPRRTVQAYVPQETQHEPT